MTDKIMPGTILPKKRIEYIDLAKGICIIMVVLYHIASCYDVSLAINAYFKLFRLPLYFFLSGVFFKTYGSGSFLGFIKRKTNKLLIPFAFWYLLLSVGLPLGIYYLFGLKIGKADNFSLISALPEFWTREYFPNIPIWFLLCLFFVNIHFYFIKWIASLQHFNKEFVIALLSMIYGAVGVTFWHIGINLPGFLDTAFTAVPFFYFGYWIKNHTKILVPNEYDKYLIGTSFALFTLLALFLVIIETWHIGGYTLLLNRFKGWSALYVYPCGFVGTLAVILLAKKIKRIPLVSFYGRYSIMILVTHLTLLKFYSMSLSQIGIADSIGIYINLVITLLSYLVLIPFMRRFMPHVTAQKDVIKV